MTKPITRNVDFGEKTEIMHKLQLDELRAKLDNKHVCSKGITRCVVSLNRVKDLSKKFIYEKFQKKGKKGLSHISSRGEIQLSN